MRKQAAWAVIAVLMCVSLGSADLVLPQPRQTKQEIGGYRVRAYTETYKANERAFLMVSGRYRSCLQVYVFDAQGNCVAKDDGGDPQTADDLLTEWVPSEQTRYSVEVRNAGYLVNQFQVAFR